MQIFVGLLGLALLFIVLWDGFETIVLPRRVVRRIRITRLFYQSIWFLWSGLGRRMKPGRRRDTYLGIFGPLSMLFLLMLWAFGLLVGFSAIQWAFGSGVHGPLGRPGFLDDLYFSGTTFFTLGLGDVTPRTGAARALAVVEAGTGFGFLAMVIGYLPVLYQGFSRREANISLLDARAGSPPSASELLGRHGRARSMGQLTDLLKHWEVWSAELLETHISYPVLGYFRSQHNNESWLAALTAILDACTFLIATGEGDARWQARLTFAMARHAVVDLSQVYKAPPRTHEPDRLPPASLTKLIETLRDNGLEWKMNSEAVGKIKELTRMYEPYINALSMHFLLNLPPWIRTSKSPDNWQTSAWERASSRTGVFDVQDDHLD